MTTHHIKLETDGKYCGKNCDKNKQNYCYEFVLEAHYPTKLRHWVKGCLRCQACLDSEIKGPPPKKKTRLHSGLTAKEFKDHPDFNAWDDSQMMCLAAIELREA